MKLLIFDEETVWSIYRRQFEPAVETNEWNSQEREEPYILPLRDKFLKTLSTIPYDIYSDIYSDMIVKYIRL